MNSEYRIKVEERVFIEIAEPKLLALQSILNTINVYPFIQDVIDKIIEIKEKYPDLYDLAENKYNGYWEDEELGTCFTIIAYDNGLDVFINDNVVFIEDEYLYPSVPRVSLSLDEFIKTLENWRDILKSNPEC